MYYTSVSISYQLSVDEVLKRSLFSVNPHQCSSVVAHHEINGDIVVGRQLRGLHLKHLYIY